MKSAMKSNATDGAAPSVTIQVPEAGRTRNIALHLKFVRLTSVVCVL